MAMHTTTASRAARRFLAAAAVLLAPWLILTAGATAAQGAETTTRIDRAPVDFRVFVPCANDGSGEVVHLTGRIIGVIHSTFDEGGGFHVTSIEVEQGVRGVGDTTGDRYASTFVNMFHHNEGTDGLPNTSTQELIFRLNGQGPGNESLLRIRNHSTINANGTVTVAFDNASAECETTTP